MNPPGAAELLAMIGEPIEPVRFHIDDLDPSTSPCVDLDAFVNARWRAANPVPPDRSAWDSFAVLHERSLQVQAEISAAAAAGQLAGDAARVVGDFWVSGLSDAACTSIDPLRDELRSIESLASVASLTAYIGERHARGWPLLFAFDIAADFDLPVRHIACVSQAGLGVSDPGFYLGAGTHAIRDAYATHLAGMLAWGGVDAAGTEDLADAVVAFERRLAAVSTTHETLARDISLKQHRVTLSDANAMTPAFRWDAFFERQGVDAPPAFSLAMPAFHREWNAMLDDTPLHVWRAYLACHTMASVAPDVGSELGMLHHHFHGAALQGKSTASPRWKQVIASINSRTDDAMGELYVARTFSGRAREKVQDLVEGLRASLHARILALDWMGDQTRAYALHKLDAMRAKIGGPARWRDWSNLHTSPHDWLGNLLAARAHDHAWVLSKLDTPVDPDEWPMTPQTVNAGYEPQANQVVFPAAILQPPFFDENADDAFNYGAIGAVIAHEMTHGYDDQGSRFGVDGRFENWWSDADRARFERAADSLVALFDRECGAGGEPVNGRLTLGENIADFGGLAIAYDAFTRRQAEQAPMESPTDGYSARQRFFLSWATIWRQNLTPDESRRRLRIDPHAPASLRANSAPANMREFFGAFDATGSALEEPLSRVRIW